ncbi:MAG: YceI family protein [Candidatus Berkiella sp.]
MNLFPKVLSLITAAIIPVVGYCEAVEYTLDKSHTSVNWQINHFDFSNYYGKWEAMGKLWFDKEKPQNSKVEVDIKIEDLITGNDKLNKHLKGADFFDQSQYPEAKFVSNKVIVKNGKVSKVEGDLTLHGVTKPVVLDVTSQKLGKNMADKETAGFSAKTKIKRSDFGMIKFLPGLADEVKLNIEVEANK